MAPADNSAALATSVRNAARTDVSALARLLLPNLAAILTAASLLYCLFLFDGGRQLFRDSDSGWHIRAGEQILAQRALPATDPYSFSKAGEPWVLWEWGADAMMGAVHRMDGLRGVAVLFALAIVACLWLSCRLHFATGGDFFLLALMAPLTITASSLHWLARPHIFSWLFLLGAVLYAESAAPTVNVRRLLAIGAFTALWANLHASFLLAPAVALIYGVAHTVRPWIWSLDSFEERQKARAFFAMAVAAFAGSLLNPYGWYLHQHVISYLLDEQLTSRVAEFQSFNFHDADALQIAMVMAIGAIGAMLLFSQKKLGPALLSAILVFGALRSARMIPLVALLILPLANGAITEALHSVRDLRPNVSRAVFSALTYSFNLRRFDRQLSGAAFLTIVVLLSVAGTRTQAFATNVGFSPATFPVGLADSVSQLPQDARLLAPDSYGGYLIYRFSGARKVFFDGRSDFYGADFMKQYLTLITARPGWQDIVASYRFNNALLPADSTLKAALVEAGWKVQKEDRTAALLEAPERN